MAEIEKASKARSEENDEQEAPMRITAEQAAQVLQAARQQGMERCRAKIAMALKEEGYVIEGVLRPVRDSDGGWRFFIDIQLREAQ